MMILSIITINFALKIIINTPVYHIQFIGEHGKILYEVDHVSEAQYVIKDSDPYVRVEIHCNDASVLYLNPVTRHESSNISDSRHPR